MVRTLRRYSWRSDALRGTKQIASGTDTARSPCSRVVRAAAKSRLSASGTWPMCRPARIAYRHPDAPTIPCTFVSRSRTLISYPTYACSPAFAGVSRFATLTSRADARPTDGSPNAATRCLTAAGWMRTEASVLTTISPVRCGRATFSAAVLPCRRGSRNSSTPRSAKRETISSVRSFDASDTTRI